MSETLVGDSFPFRKIPFIFAFVSDHWFPPLCPSPGNGATSSSLSFDPFFPFFPRESALFLLHAEEDKILPACTLSPAFR